MMKHILSIGTVIAAITLVIGLAWSQEPAEKPADILEGVLRLHPKFHYRYYIDGFGNGQKCALFGADGKLAQIKPGSLIRVRGKLGSKFFGDPNDKLAAVIPTWVIYLNVDHLEVLREPSRNAPEPPVPPTR